MRSTRDRSSKGQVRLSKGEFTTSISDNLMTLYLNDDVIGEVTLTLEPAIRSRSGQKLIGMREFKLEFANTKPQVRFVGKGVILPDATTLSVPFEAVSARAVRVTALQVFEPNIPQFLQVNPLSGSQELGRVGRVLWRKTIPLASPIPGKWTRYDLDVTELSASIPAGFFSSPCHWRRETRSTTVRMNPKPRRSKIPNLPARTMPTADDPSNWDYAEEYYGDISWNERDDPCKAAYYRYGSNIRDARNLLASNIGLIAKRAQRGKLLAVATALDSARPLAGVKIDVMSYQNQVLASGRTDANGMVELDPRGTPFALIADDGGRKGYLRVANGVALPVSHFDVGGESVVGGTQGISLRRPRRLASGRYYLPHVRAAGPDTYPAA